MLSPSDLALIRYQPDVLQVGLRLDSQLDGHLPFGLLLANVEYYFVLDLGVEVQSLDDFIKYVDDALAGLVLVLEESEEVDHILEQVQGVDNFGRYF